MLNKANALEKLRRQQAAIDQIPPSMSSPEFKKWKRDTEVAIANVFGEHTRHAKEFDEIRYGLIMFTDLTPDSAWTDACRDGLTHANVMLQSMIDEIQEYRPDAEDSAAAKHEEAPLAMGDPLTLLESLRSVQNLADHDDVGLDAWRRRTRLTIRHLFGDASPHLKDVARVSAEFYSPIEAAWETGKAKALNLVESLIEEIVLRSLSAPLTTTPALSRDVFVVHGHEEAMKQSVCRTLEKLGLNPIVLHEQPNRGRTIIEKFTAYATVGFAVVLLSADDVGCEHGKEPDGLRPRARQNVILELGFFLGKLGRGHVMALSREVNNFDLPSDYSGVIFTPFDDARHWGFELVRELRAARYRVDANKLV